MSGEIIAMEFLTVVHEHPPCSIKQQKTCRCSGTAWHGLAWPDVAEIMFYLYVFHSNQYWGDKKAGFPTRCVENAASIPHQLIEGL